MQIQVLEEFVELAETLRFTSAAKNMFISQSTLSKHISALEKEMGSQLFIRDASSVELSAEGEILYAHAKNIIREYSDAIGRIARYRKGLEASLSVGYLMGACKDFLPLAYSSFMQRSSSIDTRLFTMEPDQIYHDLIRGRIDLGVTMCMPNYALEDFESRMIFEDRIGLVVVEDHPLAQLQVATFDDLAPYQMILPSKETYPLTFRYYENLMDLSGHNVANCTSFFDLASVASLLASTSNIAIMSGHLQSYFGPSVKFVPFDSPDTRVPVSAIWRKGNKKPAIYAMVECIDDAYRLTMAQRLH